MLGYLGNTPVAQRERERVRVRVRVRVSERVSVREGAGPVARELDARVLEAHAHQRLSLPFGFAGLGLRGFRIEG